MKGVPFLKKKMVYKRVRGWNSGQSLPVENYFEYPPPLPREITLPSLTAAQSPSDAPVYVVGQNETQV